MSKQKYTDAEINDVWGETDLSRPYFPDRAYQACAMVLDARNERDALQAKLDHINAVQRTYYDVEARSAAAEKELAASRAEAVELRAELADSRAYFEAKDDPFWEKTALRQKQLATARLEAQIEAWHDALHMAVDHGNPEEFIREYMEGRIVELTAELERIGK